ncbi:glycine cleavage system aminomethyltransferase GcvT [Leucobacter sp. W1153]|uniref:glycine cleavage system aminomethyltransferase GcvT n=1 Tax=Leucobacter sp. W1153 TaxID=3439064 RepID=UPI003F40CB4F
MTEAQHTPQQAPQQAAQRTPLHAEHAKLGSTFTDFGGWDMPLKYGSELAEHRAVREAAGLFDLSHMGEIWIEGPDAVAFLNTALVGDLGKVAVGRAKYSLICDERGGIIDDLITYRLGDQRFLVVPNAGNTPVVAAAFAVRAKGFDVSVTDASLNTGLIAVQGPASAKILSELIALAAGAGGAAQSGVLASDAPSGEAGNSDRTDIAERMLSLRYYGCTEAAINDIPVIIARTGYTGEDGFELYVPNEQAAELWTALLAAGEPHGLIPAGLAARDSLRLEAGMPLYGNELSLEVTPFEAGLGAVVSFAKEEAFVGREALGRVEQQGSRLVLVGLRGLGRRAGRGGYLVYPRGTGAARDTGAALAAGGPGTEKRASVQASGHPNGAASAGATAPSAIGRITSGQPSPTLGTPIALAYVEPEFAEVGTPVNVDLRGKLEPFEVVPLPFYRRPA